MRMTSIQATHVIYIPGLGDGYDPTRKFLLGLWRYKNISVELVPMLWSQDDGFEAKQRRVSDAIDRAVALNKRVVLVGESAGGSMAVNIYAAHKNNIARVITLCGKNTHPETVSPRLYKKNPAFYDSMNAVGTSIDSLNIKARREFTSIHPIYDPVVPIRETLLDDCRQVRIFAYGHLAPILLLLSIFSPVVAREVRRNISQ